ncbi:unnamed protein product [Effrenium voratum]|nr:unnamed protein product [Effrenium voratum]
MCSEQLLGSRDSVSPMRWPVLIQLVLGVAADNSSCSGLTLLQKVPSLQHQFVLATELLGVAEQEWVPVDGGVNRACRGASAGDNLASYFTVERGLADLAACQALCESNAACKGVEYHVSGRCEIWTRPAGVQASISLTDYYCYALELSDFIPVDAGTDRACRGDNAMDDAEAYKVVSSASSLSECKGQCRSNSACRGIEYGEFGRCEVWTRDILASVAVSRFHCLKLEFTAVNGDGQACRGSTSSDNNPAHYTVAPGAGSEAACKQACRVHGGCMGIEYSPGRCELWTRPEGIQATAPLPSFACLAYHGGGTVPSTTTTTTTTTTTFTSSSVSIEQQAQFLIQASFGPTLASLEAMKGMTFQQWINNQMALPPQSHREFWRKRVNPYVLSADIDRGELVGLARSRCDRGSRWVGYTFQRRDEGKPVRVSQGKILVDGLHRSDIDPQYEGNGMSAPQSCSDVAPDGWQSRGEACTADRESMAWNCYEEFWKESELCQQTCFDQGHGYAGDDCSSGWVGVTFEGFVCRVKENAVGAWVQLGTSSGCEQGLMAMTNPHVWRASPTSDMTQALNFIVFRPGVIHLTASPDQCNLGTIVRSDVEATGRFYLLESRLELVENTVEKPASSGSWVRGTCPAVTRTFLNAGSCKLLPGCLPVGVQQIQLPLDSASFQKFFAVGGRYVYAIKGLRTSAAPCGQRSRWKKLDCATESCSTTSMPSASRDAIQAELTASASQGWLRDVDLTCSNVPANAVVEVGSDTFQHVHLDEFNVFDFTDWSNQHPGGKSKITQWTSQGFELEFPSWHGMDRWDEGIAPGVLRPNLVGKYKATVHFQELPQPLQTQALMDEFGSGGQNEAEYSIVCGSPGEVANDALLGHQLAITHGGEYDWHFDMEYYSRWGTDRLTKSAVWTMQALHADDQLRQRMAWALSQILVMAVQAGNFDGQSEMWLSYYDIFVRNAFGNFRDALREVAYNPLMGSYLTYKRNRAFDESNNYPDENFAREIMQLFTIGLWKLNPDGTRAKDGAGKDIPTYTNEHIMNFARVFTGFDEQPRRDNIEFAWNNNLIDPMRIVARWHDAYPKPDLDGNFLGDGYPLCADLPTGYFLRAGAKYEFIGHSYAGSDVLNLTESSLLFARLCDSSGAPCKHRLTWELDNDLACSGPECTVNTVSVVNVAGGFYRYMPPTCVNLFFFNGQVTRRGGRAWGWTDECQNPNLPVAGAACCGGCKNRKDWWWLDHKKCSCENATTACPQLFTEKCNNDETWREHQWCRLACWENDVGYAGDDCTKGPWRGERVCGYPQERVIMATAERECASRGLEVCWERMEGFGCGLDEEHVWTPESCSHEVIVYSDGKVSSNYTSRTRQNKFFVPWKSGFPVKTGSACPSGCRVHDDGCSCSMTVQARSVFSTLPSGSELSQLKIGAVKPAGQCTQCSGPVRAYGAMDDPDTVFEHQGKFYKNKELVVLAGGFEFRNPPVFVTLEDPREPDVHAEVESLLDHLFFHPNTAPFISYRLMQRFGTSNPTPAYVQDVATAFRTGTYNGRTYSGVYGDLGATVAAILLHPEARSQSTASNGALREPLLKVIHFMRSMEYKDGADRNVLLTNLMPRIGQFPFLSPSVFNFFLPGFKPDAFPDAMVGPEFEIFTPPLAISFVNGLTSLIERGLGVCDGGFGFESPSDCSTGELTLGELDCLQPTIDQLDLLLTGGRLHDKEMIYSAYRGASGGHEYKLAQMAMVMTPEFHTFGSPLPMGPRTSPPPEVASDPRSYKALVMVFMNGGADTFNMLVPMNCGLYDEYTDVRRSVALSPSELNTITTNGQACGEFGIHSRLTILKESCTTSKRWPF